MQLDSNEDSEKVNHFIYKFWPMVSLELLQDYRKC